jgi:hypothetical protein
MADNRIIITYFDAIPVIGMVYDYENHRWVLTIAYIDKRLNESIQVHFLSIDNANEISDRASRRFYDYFYKHKTWPEDFFKKEFLLNTELENVEILREIMISDMESIIQSRRDLLMGEHGIDIDKGQVIEDFYKTLENHEFSPQTIQIYNRNNFFAYKEKLNHFTLLDEDKRNDY